MTLEAHLTRSGLRISRTYAPDENEKPIVNVTETVENLLGVERVFGRAQHVSVGASMLEGSSCRFACNADRGLTWPEPTSTFRHNTSFKYPMIPTKGKASTDEAHCDWRQYPRGHPNSDLLTLRIRPQDKHGWFVAERTLADGNECAYCLLSIVNVFVHVAQLTSIGFCPRLKVEEWPWDTNGNEESFPG